MAKDVAARVDLDGVQEWLKAYGALYILRDGTFDFVILTMNRMPRGHVGGRDGDSYDRGRGWDLWGTVSSVTVRSSSGSWLH